MRLDEKKRREKKKRPSDPIPQRFGFPRDGSRVEDGRDEREHPKFAHPSSSRDPRGKRRKHRPTESLPFLGDWWTGERNEEEGNEGRTKRERRKRNALQAVVVGG